MRKLYGKRGNTGDIVVAFKIGGSHRQYKRDMDEISRNGIKIYATLNQFGKTATADAYIPAQNIKKMLEMGFSISGTHQKFMKKWILESVERGLSVSDSYVMVHYNEENGEFSVQNINSMESA